MGGRVSYHIITKGVLTFVFSDAPVHCYKCSRKLGAGATVYQDTSYSNIGEINPVSPMARYMGLLCPKCVRKVPHGRFITKL